MRMQTFGVALTVSALAGASALENYPIHVSTGFEAEALSLLQTKVHLVSPHFPDVELIERGAHRLSQLPDMSARIAVINKTVEQATAIITFINETAVGQLQEVRKATASVVTSLASVQHMADALAGGAAQWIAEVTDKLQADANAEDGKLNAITAAVQLTLHHLIDSMMTAKDSVWNAFDAAISKVNTVSAPIMTLLATQEGEVQRGPIDWVMNAFGNRNHFDQARTALLKANSTVLHMSSLLESLNATASDVLMAKALDAGAEGLAQLGNSLQSAIGAADASIPTNLKQQIAATSKTLSPVAARISEKAGSALKDIQAKIVNAQGALPQLYGLTTDLMGAVDAAEQLITSKREESSHGCGGGYC